MPGSSDLWTWLMNLDNFPHRFSDLNKLLPFKLKRIRGLAYIFFSPVFLYLNSLRIINVKELLFFLKKFYVCKNTRTFLQRMKDSFLILLYFWVWEIVEPERKAKKGSSHCWVWILEKSTKGPNTKRNIWLRSHLTLSISNTYFHWWKKMLFTNMIN